MNRMKKEEIRKKKEARAGLPSEEIEKLDQEDAVLEKIEELAGVLHYERFPEEYDAYLDSSADVTLRNRGINPMSNEYISRVNEKRKEEGVPPLSASGFPTDKSTWEICYAEAEKQVRASLSPNNQEV